MSRTLDDLSTPCVLVDEDVMQRNLRRMQERADGWRVALRPHVKTHKSTQLAREQLRLGASGLTVATVAEAEVFVRAGFSDVCIAYTVIGADKLARIAAIAPKSRVSFCVDSEEGARQASEFFASRSAVADVLVEVDTGHGRCGVRWDDARLAGFFRFASSLPGLRIRGLLTHAGQSYRGPSEGESKEDALRRAASEERDRLLDAAVGLKEAGLLAAYERASGRVGFDFVLSIGSTPSLAAFEPRSRQGMRVTEIRPGNYIFHDAMQVGLGSARLSDCALTVLAAVVSKRRDRLGSERVYLDAGKKVLTTDRGYDTDGFGVLLYNATTMTPLPHAHLVNLSEEHGWVEVAGGSTLEVGDRVRVVPNHACLVAATQSRLFRVRGDEVVGEVGVDG